MCPESQVTTRKILSSGMWTLSTISLGGESPSPYSSDEMVTPRGYLSPHTNILWLQDFYEKYLAGEGVERPKPIL